MPRSLKSLLFASLLLSLPACAGRQPTVVAVPEAPLGRVIIYRNGVAYFERQASVEGTLNLRVPRARVDDFLKSLTVTDAQSGKPLPISYPTLPQGTGQWVDMTIQLPPGRHQVEIAYVTESPAWKPSYRVMLGDDDKSARLQSWAIVDNVSGERWDKVKVGVGSTSALSFRYDLHSVQLVERETLDTGTRLAQAPPTGGSPYAVDGGKVRVLANISTEELSHAPVAAADSAGISLSGRTVAMEEFRNIPVGNSTARDFTQTVRTTSAGRKSRRARRNKSAGQANVEPTTAQAEQAAGDPLHPGLDALHASLVGNQQRVRIEGYGLAGEAEPQVEGLRRANTLRERLVAQGIEADRIEVVAGSHTVESSNDVVQVVAIDDTPAFTEAVMDGVGDDEPRGTAHFLSDKAMSLEPGHSAMVTLFDEPTKASRVYLYDPLSSRGSKRFAFNAVRVQNPSDNTLDSGPITVYAKGRFLGEGLTEPVPPHESALVPYALDRSIVVEPTVQTREEVERLVTVERGIATTQTRRTRTTTLTIDNRGHAQAKLYVRHHVASGWTLEDPPEDLETMGRDVLVPVTIAAGSRAELTLEESMPVTTALDLRSDRGLEQIAVFLEGQAVAEPLREQLDLIVHAYRSLATVDDTLVTRREQMGVLRERVDELSGQLTGLRKVKRAQDLSGHLAKRMRELSDRLDDLTVEVTDLEADRLKALIELQNLVAELSLEEAGGDAVASVTTGGTPSATP